MRDKRAVAIVIWTALAGASPLSAGDFEATYRLSFEADWSVSTHPLDFPPNPHFSSLVGATHDDSARLWQPGSLASAGVEAMAEDGITGTLTSEASELAGVDEPLRGGGIGRSPGLVSLEFQIRQSHPLISIVSMLAPSPDWFVGTDSLNLRKDGAWREEVVVDLFVYDAGTDSGASYTAANSNTSPAEPIRLLDAPPFDNGIPVGRYRFELLGTSGDQPIAGYHSGLYFDPERDGEGVNVNIARLGERQVLSVTWYSFDQGEQLYLVGNVDFEAGARSATLELFSTGGALFGSQFRPEDVDLIPWGSATLRFPSCATLELDYDGGPAFGTGTLAMQQLVPIEGLNCD